MARGIPKVRKWRVNYWADKTVVRSYVVDAPTKTFALWAARDILWAEGIRRGDLGMTRVTAGVIKG
jgi:hypothetical protein